MRIGVRPRYNPAEGIADFWHEIRRPTPYRWPIVALSLLSSLALMWWIVSEEVLVPPPRPKVAYIKTFAANRSDAEIVADNIANQKIKDRLAAEQAARDEEVKAMYRKLGRATGIDVDAMERQIAKDKAAEAAAARARPQAPGAGASLAPAAR